MSEKVKKMNIFVYFSICIILIIVAKTKAKVIILKQQPCSIVDNNAIVTILFSTNLEKTTALHFSKFDNATDRIAKMSEVCQIRIHEGKCRFQYNINCNCTQNPKHGLQITLQVDSITNSSYLMTAIEAEETYLYEEETKLCDDQVVFSLQSDISKRIEYAIIVAGVMFTVIGFATCYALFRGKYIDY
ncbi:uncharacterized protein LOC131939934 [Physella acuta]|uniref:uncharacterized protein LOC131939934 n=1 Tax=Physella acuta TaxID=109671 RepID=UPI0027DE392C|nr:uncharacterized protein LOC131939934 [Physella acuta]